MVIDINSYAMARDAAGKEFAVRRRVAVPAPPCSAVACMRVEDECVTHCSCNSGGRLNTQCSFPFSVGNLGVYVQVFIVRIRLGTFYWTVYRRFSQFRNLSDVVRVRNQQFCANFRRPRDCRCSGTAVRWRRGGGL